MAGRSRRLVTASAAVVTCAALALVAACFTNDSSGDGPAISSTDSTAPPDTATAVVGPWEAARRAGVDFRAVGQEPGWHLEIDDQDSIVVVTDYGNARAAFPVPPPPDTVTARTVYAVATDSHDLTIHIERQPCQDTMSGEAFEATVTIVLDGVEYRGCGRWLGPAG